MIIIFGYSICVTGMLPWIVNQQINQIMYKRYRVAWARMKHWHMHWPVQYRNWMNHMIEIDVINNSQCLVEVVAAVPIRARINVYSLKFDYPSEGSTALRNYTHKIRWIPCFNCKVFQHKRKHTASQSFLYLLIELKL